MRNDVRTPISLAQKPKLAVGITLNDQQNAYVSSYTTLEPIEGVVSITASQDTQFDDVRITFEGSTRTYVEKVATTAPTNPRTHAYHNFLRLTQPISDESLPESRVAETGRTYTFPFHFVVPEKLLPQTCVHPVLTEEVNDAHLNLPPSLGDPMLASDGRSLMDDLAPAMTTISYAIKVRVVRGQGSEDKPLVLANCAKKLRIIPATEELPFLDAQDKPDGDYVLRKEKDVRKGMFKGKLGRLTMEASQPRSIRLPPPRTQLDPSQLPTTVGTVTLRFDPADESASPPRLGQLWNRLKVATFFGTVPMREFPTRASVGSYDNQRGLFVETLNLSSRCVESAQWKKHTSTPPPAPIRRDSGISTTSVKKIPDPSSAYLGGTFYTAELVVPITLPKYRTFTPTFHTCLVSRIYALDFSLGIQSPGSGLSAATLHLKVPLQISSAGSADVPPSISAAEMEALATREVDELFDPRAVSPPSPAYTERAGFLQPGARQMSAPAAPPPGYSFIATTSHGRAMDLGMSRALSVSAALG